MPSSPGFQFRQFYVRHDKCAMKVGTDGVLLGCWTPTFSAQHILDIGTGCGLIALMLAQRTSSAQIDAIDINPEAALQASENFLSSPWHDRLHSFNTPLQDFQNPTQNAQATTQNTQATTQNILTPQYELIVSNPPYFQNSLKNPDSLRQLARHTDSLSFEQLLYHCHRLLSPNGHLALILPADAENEITSLAASFSLYCTRITRVHGRENKLAKRVLLLFQYCISDTPTNKKTNAPLIDTLVLETPTGQRTDAYSTLAADFYL